MKPLSTSELRQMLDDLEAHGFGAERGGSGSSGALFTAKAPLDQMLPAPNPQGIPALAGALSYISSDVPRGTGTIIGPDSAPVPDYWLGVVLAVRREYGEAGKEVVRQWSQQSSRYTDAGFEHAWKQYKPGHAKPVTIGSVFMLAKAFGWQKSSSATSPTPHPSANRFRLLDRTAIMTIQPIQWRVKGLLPATGIAAIFGPSGSGKSFLAKDLGASIALGQDWFGHRTTRCNVTYVMLEAEGGLRNRVEAWEAHNGRLLPPAFKAMTQPFQLAEPEQVEELGALLPVGGVVIVDTLNRAAPGLDENSSQDMGRILAGMKRLQEVTGGLVLIVHHTGKDASKGMRGHSSLHAALDGAIEVERSAAGRHWSAAKVKDGEDGKQVAFQLHRVVLGTDGDGDEVSSCAVGPDTGAVFRPREPSGKNQKSALSTIRRSLSISPETGQAGCDPQTHCLKVEDAIAAVAATLTAKASNKRSNEARRLVSSLTSGGYVQSAIDAAGEAWLWQ
ncbi:AAA family ATPase [Sandarakinorhabdus oryzae]|uniref:AAA family ATPase n=1 Tax=Sandarakinorhabdus oryzae TaxID=2675220 RepID=UPI0012E10D0A|nr:AAA family ATPase [Sandarakinorhabdus oryzae]